jgi:outer membrane lipoprotein-sorting protein
MNQAGIFAAAFAIAATPFFATSAEGKDALPLMQAVDKRLKARDEVVSYDMELYEGAKLTHARKLVRSDKVMPEKNSTVVRFTHPDSVKNVSLLIEDSGAAINDIWSYTPSVKSLRRISGAQKQNWFMGTEFTYEDFEDFKLKTYDFVELQTQSPCLIWARCTVVEAKPKSDAELAASGYSRKRYFIEAESLFPIQVEYFDSTGMVTKRLVTENIRNYGGHFRATAQTMFNLTNHRRTRMVVADIKLNQGLPDSRFSQRYLRSESE